jgi:hypothetical protein
VRRILIECLAALIPASLVVAIGRAEDGPKPEPGKGASASNPSRRIDLELAKSWKAHGLVPSRLATDEEFIRRVTLDILGRIATPEEIRRFQSDPALVRRTRLIERLLASGDYAKNWAVLWTNWLITRTGPAAYHEALRKWLENELARTDSSHERMVRELLTAGGRSDRNGAVNYLLMNLGEPLGRPKGTRHEEHNQQYNMVPATARTVQLFLGVRLQCTQCHDDLLHEEWKQEQYWGMNAFLRQVERRGPPLMNGRPMAAPDAELVDNPDQNGDGLVRYEKRNGSTLSIGPTYLDGRRPATPGRSWREELARLVIQDDRFAKAYVNRVWAHFFGRGLNAPAAPDDLCESMPVNYPELLNELAGDFRASGTNPRSLVRWICNSQAYQLSSAANASNAKSDAEPYFCRMNLKVLSPEQLFESLMVVTQLGETETDVKRAKLRDAWMRNLIVNFGDDEGNEATFNGTVVQALLLMNGQEINATLANTREGPLIDALSRRGATVRSVMEALFIRILNRWPTAIEYREIPVKMSLHAIEPTVLAPWQDLAWALVNSNEFMLNH